MSLRALFCSPFEEARVLFVRLVMPRHLAGRRRTVVNDLPHTCIIIIVIVIAMDLITVKTQNPKGHLAGGRCTVVNDLPHACIIIIIIIVIIIIIIVIAME